MMVEVGVAIDRGPIGFGKMESVVGNEQTKAVISTR